MVYTVYARNTKGYVKVFAKAKNRDEAKVLARIAKTYSIYESSWYHRTE